MSDVHQPYAHQKLDAATSIGLVRVTSELVNGCIACEIRHFNLPEIDETEFKALSYLWGDPTPTKRIYLTDVETRGEWRLWWTDCICLHQNDNNEMSQQIHQMGVIYSSAEEVVIWLDLPGRVEKEIQGLKDRTNVGPFSFEDRRGYLPAGTDKVTHFVTNHEYWGRVWILQEVILAKRATVMIKTIPPFEFRELRKYVGIFSLDPSAPDMNKLYSLCNSKKHQLWEILKDFDSYKSTKPNDRLYGLLGLVAINYDKPLCDVMPDAVFESQPPLYLYECQPNLIAPSS